MCEEPEEKALGEKKCFWVLGNRESNVEEGISLDKVKKGRKEAAEEKTLKYDHFKQS